jgi:glycerol uptake facilitator-like aquaporin
VTELAPRRAVHRRHVELGRRCVAEAIGTAFLVAAVVGSGVMAMRLTSDEGLQLLANAAATAGALIAVIYAFMAVSGAHLNPIVTLTARASGTISTTECAAYVAAQVTGACAGTVVANLMFELSAVDWSTKDRISAATFLAEIVATYGLIIVISGIVRAGRSGALPLAVGAYIGAGYWFTSSTAVANPAATIGRTLSDTFAGIAPASAPGFITAQLLGGGLAAASIRYLFRSSPTEEILDA